MRKRNLIIYNAIEVLPSPALSFVREYKSKYCRAVSRISEIGNKSSYENLPTYLGELMRPLVTVPTSKCSEMMGAWSQANIHNFRPSPWSPSVFTLCVTHILRLLGTHIVKQQILGEAGTFA